MGLETALVHEWLTNMAGSERVVAALRRIWPGAPVYTSMRWPPAFADWDGVRTSFLQPLATGPRAHVRALPLMPAAFRSLRPKGDLVVTSFHTFAVWARVAPGVPSVVYCHTPPRFLWSAEQLRQERIPGGAAALRAAGALLRPADRRYALRSTRMIANSHPVAERIKAAYGVEAAVVHPPVDVDRFASALGTPAGDYFVVLSRLVAYKRLDLAVAAFTELRWPLVVVGTGRAEAALRATAPAWISFAGHVEDKRLPTLLAGARALIVPAEEDFGIAIAEAMAAGTPVVAFKRGGALDSINEGLTGIFFAEPTVASLVRAVRAANDVAWDRKAISNGARRFGEDRFRSGILEIVSEVLP